MKNWIIGGLIAAALALAAMSYASLNGGTPVEAARATRGDIREYIDEEAKTRLEHTYLITMPFDGRLEAIDLTEGAPVTKGQVVARVVPSDLELNVEIATAAVEQLKASIRENDDTSVEATTLRQALSFVESMNRTVEAATAQVESGQAKLDYAEKLLSRIQKLARTNAKTEDELDKARVNKVESSVEYQQDVLLQRAVESMRAATALLPTAIKQYIQRKDLSRSVLEKQLAEAQVRLEQVKKDRQRGTMVSPVDGVVLEREITNERRVSAGTVLLRIGRWEALEVEADVLSQEVVRVRTGQAVDISGSAIGAEPAKGTVARVYPAGFTKVSSLGVEQQRVKVIVKLEPAELQRIREERHLGVDYRVRVRLFTAEQTGALVIPRSALFRGAENDWRVFAVIGGKATLRSVQIGLSNDERAEVTKGLAVNDAVILAPESNLSDGQRVRIVGNH